MSGPKSIKFLCRGIEIDLTLKWGSKVTRFQWWGQNYLGFSVGIEIDLFFLRVVEVDVCGPKLTRFGVAID